MYPRERRPVWRHVVRLAMCVFLPASLASCAVSCTEPHEMYKQSMSSNVGRSIEKVRMWLDNTPERLVGSRNLQNGNIENEYRYRRSCRTFFEFDPNTRIIVRWRFEGLKEDCIMW